ncbi:MAG: aminomethyl transferase family protein [Sphingobium sp.]|nr:aminomethyl transferase family protein [Sphingobium sp.]
MQSQHHLITNPFIPAAPGAISWTRFTAQFEPYEFSGWVDESLSWKRTAYVGDWSPLNNKVIVKGPDALRFFQDISVNSFAKFEVGQAKHSIQCAEDGKVMVEGVLMRLQEDELLFTSGPAFWTEYQFKRGNYNATLTQHGTDLFIIQLQGPNSIHILEKATGESHRDYGFMRFRETSIAGRAFLSLRQGMSGELGFELHGRGEDALAVHQALLDAGEEFGVRRLGGRTKMVNHAEAAFPTPSVDFMPALYSDPDYVSYVEQHHPELLIASRLKTSGSEQLTDIRQLYRDPTELGWIRNIKFDHEFVGRAALEQIVAAPKRTLVSLVWNKEDVVDIFASLLGGEEPYEYMEMPRGLLGTVAIDKVLIGDRQIGVSTSRCYSHHLREMISLCSIDVDASVPGTQVEVLWGAPGARQKRVRAIVAKAPFKEDKRRIDVSTLPSYLKKAEGSV